MGVKKKPPVRIGGFLRSAFNVRGQMPYKNNIESREVNSSRSNKRLTPAEIREIRAEGKYFFHLPHIPSGQGDRAIYCVNQYLFGTGLRFGQEAERLEALKKWYFARRSPKTEFERATAEGALYRAVHWEHSGHARPFRELSESTIERMIDAKRTIACFLQANINRSDLARRKIYQSLLWLRDAGMRITRNAMIRISGCAKNTINKHADIWKICDREGSSGITREQRPEIIPLPLLDLNRDPEKKKQKKNAAPVDMVTTDSPAFLPPPDSSNQDQIRYWFHEKIKLRNRTRAEFRSRQADSS
jgi:hypothetical protein